jgi:hypothetical protein
MKYYKFKTLTDKHFCLVDDQEAPDYKTTREQLEFLKGEPFQGNWIPHKVSLFHKSKKYTDFPVFWQSSGSLIVSDKALKLLENILSEFVQFLPLAHEKYTYYLGNVTNVVDCLDENNCEINRFSDGRISTIEKYAFFIDKVKDQLIFKIPQELNGDFFVSEKFKEIIESSKLKGYQFRLAWDSEISWRDKEEKLIKLVNEINSAVGPRYSFEEAMGFVNKGYVVVSDRFAVAKINNVIVTGGLRFDGSYHWSNSSTYPPIFHSFKWLIKGVATPE